MRAVTIVGILLIVGGIASLITGGFWFTHRKTDIAAGPIQISHDSTKHVAISPLVSGIALIAGVGLVVMGTRSR